VCRRLAADCGETVNIAVLADHTALYVDQLTGSSGLQSHNWVGPAHPLARDLKRQGAARWLGSRGGGPPGHRLAGVHTAHDQQPGGSSPGIGRGASAGLRGCGRRARGRPDCGGRPDSQRPWGRDRVCQCIGAHFPTP
jgi:hypothetical protein